MAQQKRRQSNSSRTVVIAAVVLLLVVAIAGIVLATRGPASAPEVAQAPSPAAPALNAAGGFRADSADQSERGHLRRRLRQASRVGHRFAGPLRRSARTTPAGVRLSARFLTGENKARDLGLAKARAEAIRKVLAANGVGAEKIQIELVEMPAGSLTEADGNRVDLTLR